MERSLNDISTAVDSKHDCEYLVIMEIKNKINKLEAYKYEEDRQNGEEADIRTKIQRLKKCYWEGY